MLTAKIEQVLQQYDLQGLDDQYSMFVTQVRNAFPSGVLNLGSSAETGYLVGFSAFVQLLLQLETSYHQIQAHILQILEGEEVMAWIMAATSFNNFAAVAETAENGQNAAELYDIATTILDKMRVDEESLNSYEKGKLEKLRRLVATNSKRVSK